MLVPGSSFILFFNLHNKPEKSVPLTGKGDMGWELQSQSTDPGLSTSAGPQQKAPKRATRKPPRTFKKQSDGN